MSSSVDTSALSPTEALRRSKRNKFHLDVAAIHSAHPERSDRKRTAAGSLTPVESDSHDENAEGETALSSKRTRKVPNRDASYIYDDEEDDYDLGRSGLVGSHLCSKCPARFETKPGLANHMKLHQGDRRKNACDQCDFSSGTIKALKQHKRVHEKFGIGVQSTSSTGNMSIDLGCISGGSATIQQTPSASKSISAASPNGTFNSPQCSPSTRKDGAQKPARTATEARVRNNKKKRKSCPDCPFSARSLKRMENHLAGHKRTAGYKCPHCTFRSKSAGFMRRHVNLHTNSTAARSLSPPAPPSNVKEDVKNEKSEEQTVSGLFCKWKSVKANWRKFRSANEAFPHLCLPKGKRLKKCLVANCKFVCVSRSVMANHKLRQHITKNVTSSLLCRMCGLTCSNRVSLIAHRLSKHPSTTRKQPTLISSFMLLENVGRETMEKLFNNCLDSLRRPPISPPPFANNSFRIFPPASQMIAAKKPKPTLINEEVKEEVHSRSVTPLTPATPVTPLLIPSPSLPSTTNCLPSTSSTASSTSNSTAVLPANNEDESGDFKCSLCPYTTINNSRLDRHIVKHKVKSNFQCPHCTFSCRGEDLIQQHIRLHVPADSQQPVQMPPPPQPVLTTLPSLSAATTAYGLLPTPTAPAVTYASPLAISKLVVNCQPAIGEETSVAEALQSMAKSMRAAVVAAAAANLAPPTTTSSLYLNLLAQTPPTYFQAHTQQQQANGFIQPMQNGAGKQAKEEETDMLVDVVNDEPYKGYYPKLKRTWFINMKRDIAPPDMKKVKRCNECPYFTKYPCDLKTHQEMHTAKTSNNAQFRCSMCTYSTKRSMSLRQHIAMHIEENADAFNFRVRKIRLANGKFIGLKRGAGYNRNYYCRKCPFITKTLTALWMHFRHHDPTQKWHYVCSVCEFGGLSMGTVEEHHVFHPESASYTKSVYMNGDVKKELKVTIPSDKASNRSSSSAGTPKPTVEEIWNNREDSDTESSTTLYKCKECPFVHMSYQRVWTHQQKHRKPSRFTCEQCSYSIATESSLSEHLVVHLDAYIRRYSNRHFLYIGRHNKQTGSELRSTQSSQAPSPSITPLPPLHNSASCNNLSTLAASMASTPSTPPPFASTPTMVKKNTPPVLQAQQLEQSTPPEHSSQQSQHDILSSPLPPILVKEDEIPIPSSDELRDSSDEHIKHNNNIVTPAMMMDSLVRMENTLKIDISRTIQVIVNEDNSTIMKLIEKERKAQNTLQCPDCPFSDPDSIVFQLHRDLHGGRSRAYSCNICDYSCYSADALYRHISLHIPPQSPNSANKKRFLGKRRFQQSEAIPNGMKHFSCNQCTFKTINEATYAKHRIEHAQQMQIRLVSQIKRAAIQEETGKAKIKRAAKKSDKDQLCRKCSFRCETFVAFAKHSEMHGMNAMFECKLCDYSANTKSIVDFHEQNHHLDVSLTTLKKNAILAPQNVKVPIDVTPDERVRLAGGQELRCKRCKFLTYDIVRFARHWGEEHLESDGDREFLAELKMDLVPSDSISPAK